MEQLTSSNRDTQATWEYHDSTKHSVVSVTTSTHLLDWSNHPRLYKLYQDDLPKTRLPTTLTSTGVPALEALAGFTETGLPSVPSLDQLTAVLLLSAGITKSLKTPGGPMPFRAAACTGALYHIELYVVCADLPGLPAGVYHYGAHDNTLRRLRAGDYRGVLAGAAGEPAATAPVTIVYTSMYWRNAWKYQARAYRHCFWDSGTIIANTLAVATANRLLAQVLTGFVDEEVNKLLDIDPRSEFALALVPLGHRDSLAPATLPVEPLKLGTVPPSHREVDYPAIRKMHAASSLANADEVQAWRGAGRPPHVTPRTSSAPLRALEPASLPREAVEPVILRRGSSRRFKPEPISFEQLSNTLRAATHGVPLDTTAPEVNAITDLYLIANAVTGLEEGTYAYHREAKALEPLSLRPTRNDAYRMDLHQTLAANAAVNVYFMADLVALLQQWGNRAYRAAHLDASITAGRLYLAAYALGLGATGLTFYDDEVTAFFSPHARGKSVMFLIAIGVPGRPRRA